MSTPDPRTTMPSGAPAPAGGAASPPPSYEAASARLEAIIRRLDSGEAELRETLDLCREGRGLVEFCAAELDAVGQGLEELRLDELVARLEAGAGGATGGAGGALGGAGGALGGAGRGERA